MEKIMIKFVVFCVIILCAIINNPLLATEVNDTTVKNDSGIFIPLSIYKIKKIKTEKKLFIIYAEKDSKIYKIVSLKDSVDCPKKQKIRCGKEYKLVLRTFFFTSDEEGRCHRVMGVGGMIFFGKSIYVEEKRNFIMDLFEATNLKGLCITEEK